MEGWNWGEGINNTKWWKMKIKIEIKDKLKGIYEGWK
jgi:hypothetical protein